jgi:hypothetical protein
MKKIIAALVGLLLLGAPIAHAQYTYTTNNGTITVTGYTGSNSSIVIPSNINGLPVTSIGTSRFSYTYTFTNVTIPGSITNIGNFAFTGCSALVTVSLTNGLVSIGANAFQVCSQLASVNIPSTVTNVGSSAFSNDHNLVNLTIEDGVTSIAGAFGGIGVTNLVIPGSVTNISGFSGCTGLGSVIIGNENSPSTIGNSAFSSCSSLTNLVIGNSVTSIQQSAFSSCVNLPTVTIPASVTSIDISVFGGCSNLASVYFEGNAPAVNFFAFSGDKIGTAYYLPGTLHWGATYSGLPTAQWPLPNPLILTSVNGNTNFGIQSNQFGFTVSWATNLPVVVEASTSLGNSSWQPLQTNTLTNGFFYFTDADWPNYPNRYYRISYP